MICTCSYVHAYSPQLLDRRKTGVGGIFWKFARIGERLSPYISLSCLGMCIHILFFAE
eukprot:gene2947-4957_t